uniref:CRAL-TRIO domain-containing protein n=1 Tax=Parascaris univalens TaxID=6257 RepID=A0A915ATW2_PARUN
MECDENDEENLVNVHRSEIMQLRRRLSKTLEDFPSYDTDFCLLRWLRNDLYNIDSAARKFESALHTLASVGAFNNNVHTLEDAQSFLQELTPAARYFPGGIMGTDRNGNIVCVQPMGRVRPRSLMPTGRVSEFYRALILECETSMILLRNEEKKRNRKMGIIIISDIAEFSVDIVWMPASLFPDTIVKIYVINAPTIINVLYRMVKRVLGKKTVELVEFLGNDWKDVLRREIGEENLLPHWGGTMQSDLPTGSIRMGGEVPDNVRKELISSLKYVPTEQLLRSSVSARGAVTIPLEVAAPGSVLSWYFTVDHGDIDFWITYNSVEVWPRFRVSTEFVAEYGEIFCAEKGTYIVHFDNSHGKVWGKYIAYLLTIDAL